VGHDRDRDDTRTFRLSRIADVEPIGETGQVRRPDGADLRAIVDRAIGDAGGQSGLPALVWVADGQATALRRLGAVRERRRVGQRDGDVIELQMGVLDWLAREVTGYGAGAIVLEPESLRRAPAAFARDEFKAVVDLPADEGLEDSMFADGIGKLDEFLFAEVFARLQRGGSQRANGNGLYAFALLFDRSG
jgi:hypothetical protein